MDWAAHLGKWLIVFYKFDADTMILEPVLIRVFRNNLRPFICAQTKQNNCQKDSFE